MKNSIKNLLRAGVFALAAVFAFAFTEPMNPNQTVWGNDPIQGPVPVQLGSSQYECENNPSAQCLYEDEDLTMPITGSNGDFRLK
ncbi:hypothetical protein [Shivajiella indica]|uniref:Secreted protein n=1 Tax=Shivajiella indica TaxID=872115 RepID=A0ABW5BA25_9BACT